MEYIARIIMRQPFNFDFAFMLFITATFLYIIPPLSVRRDLPCRSSTCLIEAYKLQKQIDPNEDPCREFYKFVCGGHHEAHFNPTTALKKKIEEQMIEIYQQPYQLDEHLMLTMQKKLYSLCKQEVRSIRDPINIDILGKNYKMAYEVIHMLGGWPAIQGNNWDRKKFDWVNATYILNRFGFSYNLFLNISVVPDPRDISKHIFKVSQVDHMSVPNKRNLWMYELLGAKPEIMSTAIDEIHQHLVSIMRQIQYYRDSDELVKISSIQNQQKSKFNWLEFINKIIHPVAKLSEEDYILARNPHRIVYLIDGLSRVPKRVLANFMIYRLMEEMIASTMSSSCFQKIQEIFQNFAQPLDQIYLRKYLQLDTYENVREMIDYIESAALKIIKESSWFDKKDKEIMITLTGAAVKNIMVGPSKEILLDYWLVDLKENHNALFHDIVSENSYLRLFLFIQKLKRYYVFKKIHLPVNITKFYEWNLYGLTKNILDYYLDDQIVLPVTILQDYFYNSARPDYLNYGSLGTFIASELADKLVNALRYGDPWSNKTRAAFLVTKRCLMKQLQNNINLYHTEYYEHYAMLIQGLSTEISYLAYKQWEEKNGIEPELKKMKYSSKELFWIAAASANCERNTDVHHPIAYLPYNQWPNLEKWHGYFVSGIAINNQNFANDFKCKENSMMNPLKKCSMFN